MTEAGERSAYRCPRCGASRLAMLTFPEQRTMGYAPAFEIIGMGEPVVNTPPAIGCLACGAEWPNVEAVRSELARAAGTEPADEPSQDADDATDAEPAAS